MCDDVKCSHRFPSCRLRLNFHEHKETKENKTEIIRELWQRRFVENTTEREADEKRVSLLNSQEWGKQRGLRLAFLTCFVCANNERRRRKDGNNDDKDEEKEEENGRSVSNHHSFLATVPNSIACESIELWAKLCVSQKLIIHACSCFSVWTISFACFFRIVSDERKMAFVRSNDED